MSQPSTAQVLVLKTPRFSFFRALVMTEILSCMEWNMANVKRYSPNTFAFIDKQGVELWRIIFKPNELRVISSLKKVGLRQGFSFNMVHGRLEVS